MIKFFSISKTMICHNMSSLTKLNYTKELLIIKNLLKVRLLLIMKGKMKKIFLKTKSLSVYFKSDRRVISLQPNMTLNGNNSTVQSSLYLKNINLKIELKAVKFKFHSLKAQKTKN